MEKTVSKHKLSTIKGDSLPLPFIYLFGFIVLIKGGRQWPYAADWTISGFMSDWEDFYSVDLNIIAADIQKM